MRWAFKVDIEGHKSWSCVTPIGEIVVESADWLDAENPWHVTWFPNGMPDGPVIANSASETHAMHLAEMWLRRIEAQIGNVLADGCVPMDDGARKGREFLRIWAATVVTICGVIAAVVAGGWIWNAGVSAFGSYFAVPLAIIAMGFIVALIAASVDY